MSTRLTPAENAALARRISNETVRIRCANELRVLKMVCEGAIAAGYSVSLFDCEEWVVKKSRDVSELVEAAQSTDEDTLRIWEGDVSHGVVYFVYGNSGSEVINDNTDNAVINGLLKPVMAYCDRLAEKGE